MIPQLQFGRTGHISSRLIFGAAGLGSCDQTFATATLEFALSKGVNHFDTAASYGDAEQKMAPFLSRHRSNIFLATKTGDRSYQGAKESIRRSLDRMGVDNFELIQLHNLTLRDEWELAHSHDGALRALIEAKEEGIVKYIGVTGHGFDVARRHIESLGEFNYDSVLFPYNFAMLQNSKYRQDVTELLELCKVKSVAVQAIKTVAKGNWPSEEVKAKSFSWYETLVDQSDIDLAIAFALAGGDLFINSSSDYRILASTIEAISKRVDPTTNFDLDSWSANLGLEVLNF
ncbi:MAG: aldo/keto reductase [Actinomycetota bacterium]|nr:aldo/keto reductase [Actinomycetota bacterium]